MKSPRQPAKRDTLTAVHNFVVESKHNFVVESKDIRTAAERFNGCKPEPVFEWLLERMPELPRPAQKRPSASQKATTAA
jgi:hypothetical protein